MQSFVTTVPAHPRYFVARATQDSRRSAPVTCRWNRATPSLHGTIRGLAVARWVTGLLPRASVVMCVSVVWACVAGLWVTLLLNFVVVFLLSSGSSVSRVWTECGWGSSFVCSTSAQFPTGSNLPVWLVYRWLRGDVGCDEFSRDWWSGALLLNCL